MYCNICVTTEAPTGPPQNWAAVERELYDQQSSRKRWKNAVDFLFITAASVI